jgi:hypothetical protein
VNTASLKRMAMLSPQRPPPPRSKALTRHWPTPSCDPPYQLTSVYLITLSPDFPLLALPDLNFSYLDANYPLLATSGAGVR